MMVSAMLIIKKGKPEKKMSMVAKMSQNTANIHARYFQAGMLFMIHHPF